MEKYVVAKICKIFFFLLFSRLDFLSSRIESKSILNDFIHSECQFDNSLIHDDRIEAFDAASQLIEGLKVHQEKEIEKKVTKTLNKLTTSTNSGGKRNPRSKRETTVSENIKKVHFELVNPFQFLIT